jgi:1-acyl-sn-glycerol-3-phosphate acyltransferase
MSLHIRQRLARLILNIIGWKTDIDLPKDKKFIIIGAPHTTNWDLPLGILCAWSCNLKLTWMAKKQIFRGPLYYFFTALGGIPVDRSASHGLTEQIATMFEQRESLVLGLAPEGTRSKTRYWKTGFYFIAQRSHVPICFGFVDFPKRTVGFKHRFIPSGDINKDFETIAAFYADKQGKYPELQGPVIPRPRRQ